MKYKVGDKVRVKSLKWYNTNKTSNGEVLCIKGPIMVKTMSKLCGQIVTISEAFSNSYSIKEDKNNFFWSEDIFEKLINKGIKGMTKSDLKPGMVIETREGKRSIIIEVNNELYCANNDTWNNISKHYNEELLNEWEDLIIDKIYVINTASNFETVFTNIQYLTLIWERPKQVELTMDEIANKFGISVDQLKIKK